MRSFILFFGLWFVFSAHAANADDRALCFNDNTLPNDAVPACDRLIKSVKQRKEAATIFFWRGAHRLKGHQGSAAIEDFDEAIRINPKEAGPMFFRAKARFELNDFEGAVADTSSAIQINSRAPEYFAFRAAALGKLGKTDDALENISQAIRIRPALGWLYNRRGHVLLDAAKYNAAISDFSEAIRLDQKDADSYTGRAYSLNETGETDRALSDYGKAISLAPNSASAFNNRGWIFYKKRFDYKQSLSDFKTAVKLDPKMSTARHGIVISLANLEQYDEVIDQCNEWINLDQKDAIPYNYLGAAWHGKKDFDRAIDSYNEAVRLAPNDPAPFNNRGNVWREKGALDTAIRDYEKAIELNPKLSSAYSNRGLVWRAKDDVVRAIADFNRAIAVDHQNSDAFTNRGLAFEANGEIEKAKLDFRSAIESPAKYIFSKRYKEIAKARLAVLLDVKSEQQPAPTAIPSENDGRRIALVIGNGKYVHADTLANPPNDAHLISKSLHDIGFEVSDGFDLDKSAMKQTINDFLGKAAKAKTAVVFYAGHGMQVDGKNYLVPVDFDINEVKDAAAEMVNVDFILSGLDDQIRTNIIILDACRNNPLVDEAKAVAVAGRSISIRSGLATPSGLGAGATLGAGTLLAFATAPGQVALDGDGANSPFSSALGRHISTPGVEVQQMLTRVRAEVVAATKNKQVPWSNSSLLGEVYLVNAK